MKDLKNLHPMKIGSSILALLLLGLLVGPAATMYLLCVATGTACYRLAFNRR